MKFQILNTKSKVKPQFYFVLKADNGQTLVTSESYTSKQNCKKTIKLVKKSFFFTKTEDLT